MTKKELILKRNTDEARELIRRYSALKAGILSEFLHCNEDADIKELKKRYIDVFGSEELYSDMLTLAQWKNEKKLLPKLSVRHSSVACISGQLPLAAVNALTDGDKTVTVIRENDFRSVCEALAGDSVQFCTLPFCSTLAGFYPTYLRLARSYELKICKTATVQSSDGDEEIKFALFSKKLLAAKDSNTVAFSFIEDTSLDLSRLSGALHDHSIAVKSTNSRPLEYNMDKFEHTLEASLDSYSLSAFLYFLEAALPSHNVLGIY